MIEERNESAHDPSRYGTLADADNFKAQLIIPDLSYATAHNVEYMLNGVNTPGPKYGVL